MHLAETLNAKNYQLALKENRFLAALIDYLLYCIFFYQMLLHFGVIRISGLSFHFELTGLPFLCSIVVWFLIPLSERLFGQTVGKRLLNIKVVDISGEEPSAGQCIVRHLFDCVDHFPLLGMVGLIVASSTDKRQRIGDLVAKTIVVSSKN